MRANAAKLLLCLGLTLCGCGEPPRHGTVEGRTVHPEYYWLMPMWIGKTLILIPMIQPEQYSVTLHAKGEDGKETTYELYVSREQFDLIRNGDKFSCGGEQEQICKTKPDQYREDEKPAK